MLVDEECFFKNWATSSGWSTKQLVILPFKTIWAMNKKLGCFQYIGDLITLPCYLVIVKKHEDPYWTTSIMESKRVFSWLIWASCRCCAFDTRGLALLRHFGRVGWRVRQPWKSSEIMSRCSLTEIRVQKVLPTNIYCISLVTQKIIFHGWMAVSLECI